MKWITCKTEYYSWLVEVLNTKKIEQLSQNTTMFVYSRAFNIASLSFSFETCLTYWWGRTQFSRLIEHTHVHHIKKMGLTAQKNVFWTRFDESELCWKFLHVFSEVAWYKKWLRLSVQSTNCALPDTFRQKFRHQFSNFSSLFRAAAASIIVKLIMIHHKKENLCTLKIRPTVVALTSYVFVDMFPGLLQKNTKW